LSNSWICTQTYNGPTARQLDFADLVGPPPSSAYFDAIPPLHGKREDEWPAICRTSLCEDQFFPQILMPSMITELEPAFKSCSGIGYPVWDPPMILTATNELHAPSITAHSRPDQGNTPKPGAAIFPPKPSPRLTAAISSQTQLANLGASNEIFDADSRPEGSAGSRSPNSHGTPPTKSTPIVIVISGTPYTAVLGTDKSQNGFSLVLGTLTLKAGHTTALSDGQFLSYGTQGDLYLGSKTLDSVEWSPLVTTFNESNSRGSTLTLSKPEQSRGFYEPYSQRSKKSEAASRGIILQVVLTLLGFMMGAWSIFS